MWHLYTNKTKSRIDMQTSCIHFTRMQGGSIRFTTYQEWRPLASSVIAWHQRSRHPWLVHITHITPIRWKVVLIAIKWTPGAVAKAKPNLTQIWSEYKYKSGVIPPVLSPPLCRVYKQFQVPRSCFLWPFFWFPRCCMEDSSDRCNVFTSFV